jgi:hypothetical protein
VGVSGTERRGPKMDSTIERVDSGTQALFLDISTEHVKDIMAIPGAFFDETSQHKWLTPGGQGT